MLKSQSGYTSWNIWKLAANTCPMPRECDWRFGDMSILLRGPELLRRLRAQHGSGPSPLYIRDCSNHHQHPPVKRVINFLQLWSYLLNWSCQEFLLNSALQVALIVLELRITVLEHCLYPEPSKPSGKLQNQYQSLTHQGKSDSVPSDGAQSWSCLKVSKSIIAKFENYTLKRQEASSGGLKDADYTHHIHTSHTIWTTYHIHHTHTTRTPCIHTTHTSHIPHTHRPCIHDTYISYIHRRTQQSQSWLLI